MVPEGGLGRASVGTVTTSLTYLEKRKEQICCAQLLAVDRPIGSNIVGSTKKVLVEARLKEARMHGEGQHMVPMVAL